MVGLIALRLSEAERRVDLLMRLLRQPDVALVPEFLPPEPIPIGAGLAVSGGKIVPSGVPIGSVSGLEAALLAKADLVGGFVPPGQMGSGAGGGKFLRDDNTFQSLGGGAPHAVLSATHSDTTAAAVVAGDLIAGLGGGPTWQRLGIGAPNDVLTVVAGFPAWAAAQAVAHNLLSATHGDTVAGTPVRGDIIVADSTPAWKKLAKGAARTILQMGANDPAWVGPIVAAAATWHETRTFANIGTSYVVIYNTPLNGGRQPVDFTGCGEYRLIVHVNKIGTGTQSWILEDAASSSNVLQVDDSAAAANHELDSGWTALPAWATGEKTLIPKGKSTVAGDDPVVYRVVLLLR